jgi:hypothetical protein
MNPLRQSTESTLIGSMGGATSLPLPTSPCVCEVNVGVGTPTTDDVLAHMSVTVKAQMEFQVLGE